jgi:hypothetical protein
MNKEENQIKESKISADTSTPKAINNSKTQRTITVVLITIIACVILAFVLFFVLINASGLVNPMTS